MMKSLSLGLAAVLAVSVAGPPPAEAGKRRDCRPATEALLAKWGIPPSEIERIYLEPRIVNRASGSKVVGYDAWISLKSCQSGQVVVALSRSCTVRTAYTTGSCRIPAIDNR